MASASDSPSAPARLLPTIFVGSAVEDLAFAEAFQLNLDHDAEAEIWNEGTFVPSAATLSSLLAQSKRVDFAVLVASSLDSVSIRGETLTAIRDNVLFELGLFFGALGADRTFLLIDRSKAVRLPTDLAGVTLLDFDSTKANKNAAVGPACTKFKVQMRQHGRLERSGNA